MWLVSQLGRGSNSHLHHLLSQPNVSAGREELMRRRKEKAAASGSGKAKNSRFVHKIRARRASNTAVATNDPPLASVECHTRGTQALGQLIAMCASEAPEANDIAKQANLAVSSLHADLQEVQKVS